MKQILCLLSLFVAVGAGAESRQVEWKGRVQDLDAVIGSIRIEHQGSSAFFTVPEDALIRERLTRLSYADLHEGDIVAVRFWEDNQKVDRVEILQRAPAGTEVAQQAEPAAVVNR